jgi:TonB family protein
MDPLSDDELSAILRKLESTPSPTSLETRVLAARSLQPKHHWWRHALSHSVRLPAPVFGLALLAFFSLGVIAFRVNRPILTPAIPAVSGIPEAQGQTSLVPQRNHVASKGSGTRPLPSDRLAVRGPEVDSRDKEERARKINDHTLSVPQRTGDHNLLTAPEPVYPVDAKGSGLEGVVKMQVRIGTDGRVSEVTILNGNPAFIPAAVEAVKQRQYRPTLLNGMPIAVITQVDVTFRLDVTLTSSLIR